jgi:hypothetical protein
MDRDWQARTLRNMQVTGLHGSSSSEANALYNNALKNVSQFALPV